MSPSSGSGFVWVEDTLTPNVKEFPGRVDRAVFAVIELMSDRVKGHAKETAPWTDRTGNARNKLDTTTEHEALRSHSIILYHGVPYGIWLEIVRAGKNRVIVPTIQWGGTEVMKLMVGMLDRMHEGGQ